jgi:large subunit ribosomal protein L7/L12
MMLVVGRQQYREFHLTSIARGDDAPAAAAAATTSSKTGEPIPSFASPKVEALFQKIIWLDMVEVHLLAELINEKLGITISDAERERMARGGGGGGGRRASDEDAAPAEAVVEKTSFDLKLIGFDAKNKIKVIKEVRAMTSLGLKEAKELVEGVPATLKKGIKKEEAEELKALLEGLGAQIDIV